MATKIYKVHVFNIDYAPEDSFRDDVSDYGPAEVDLEVEATKEEREDKRTFEGFITEALMYETGCFFNDYEYTVKSKK